jgi:hypothetical protein
LLFALAIALHHVAALLLSRVDLVDRLLVRGQVTYAAAFAALLAVRFFALFVGPGWVLATLVVGSRQAPDGRDKPER